jgi:CDP-4-dehydro-6-deoxyglucose reductase
MGFFVLDAAHEGDVVFAATGTGITPVLPMLDELLARGERGRVHLYWGCRNREDLFWLDKLEERAAAHPRVAVYLHLTGKIPADWKGGRGRVTQPVLDLLPSLTHPTFYLVGNGAMITELKRELQARGVDRKKQIRTEAFFD